MADLSNAPNALLFAAMPQAGAFPQLPMASPVMPRFSPFNDAVTSRLAELYRTAQPSFMKPLNAVTKNDEEHSFLYNTDGNPGEINTSHENMRNRVVVYSNTAGIVHSHPFSSIPEPSPQDIQIAQKVKHPNYVVSQNAIWMAHPDGRIQQVATVDYRDGQMKLLPAMGKNALLHKP